MAFEGLSEKLSLVFKKLKSKGKLSEKDVREAMREVRLALLEADVNYRVVKGFIDKISDRAVGGEVMTSLTPSQMVIKIVNEELISLMGTENIRINTSGSPSILMLCGLQGSGKTTHAGKLAYNQKIKGHRPLLVACDIYRPAAVRQLEIVASKVGVDFFQLGDMNPVKIAKKAIKHAKDYGNDIVILDTAGRLHIDEELMAELKEIKKETAPQEVLLVIDSMAGQDAVNVAKSFDDLLDITGVVLTKLDGDTRGGAALSVRSVTGKPIKYVGVGEHFKDLEEFHPERMASRILGMGDMLSLIEQAESKLDLQKAGHLTDKMLKNKWDLNDYLVQMNEIKKMGPLKSILMKFPGMSQKLKDVDIDDKQVDRISAIILSMTPKERSKPEIINASRKKRMALGSGMKIEDINKLLKGFEQMQKMMKQIKGKKGARSILSGPGSFKKFK